MAAVQYHVFCRYLNQANNKILTNTINTEWISADDYYTSKKFYDEHHNEYITIRDAVDSNTKKLNEHTIIEQNIYKTCKEFEIYEDRLEKGYAVKEYALIRPLDSLYSDSSNIKLKAAKAVDQALFSIVSKQANVANPKYDMVFMYDGMADTDEQPLELINKNSPVPDVNPNPNDGKEIPYLYYDKMKRVELDPWFLYSTHSSLTSAIEKAKTLVGILGIEGIKIGKVVSLDQYIKIV